MPRGGAADDKAGVKAPVPESKAEGKDEDLLQGSWQAVAAEGGGQEIAAEEALKPVVLRLLRPVVLHFTGSEVTFPGAKGATFVLDPKSKPKGIVFTPTDGPLKGVKVESAIYDLSGDDLKLCIDWGRDGKAGARPTDFTTAPRDGRSLLTLKRVKGVEKDEPKKEQEKKPDEPKKDDPQAPDDAKRILGKWVQTTSAVVPNDNTIGPLARQTLTFKVNGLHTEYWVDEGSERQTTDCRYELNPTARPKELTLTSKESKSQWIYELGGGKLNMAVLDDGTRPSSFDPKDVPEGRKLKVTEFARENEEPKKEEKKPDEPARKAEFRKAYGLKDGELVKRIAPPYPDCRADYFRDRIRRRDGRNPAEFELEDELNNFTVFYWKDGTSTAGWQTRCEPNEGVSLGFVLDTVLGISKSRVEVEGVSLNEKVTGDFVVRVGADREKMAAQLEMMLRKEVGLPVRFTFKEVEEEVFVLSGKYAAKPLEDRKADEIEVYAVRLIERTVGGGGSGDFQFMIDAIERHTGRPILLDKIDGLPKAVRWHFNFRDPLNKQMEAQERDAAILLDNIAAQTGLTVKAEKREMRKLVIEHAELKK